MKKSLLFFVLTLLAACGGGDPRTPAQVQAEKDIAEFCQEGCSGPGEYIQLNTDVGIAFYNPNGGGLTPFSTVNLGSGVTGNSVTAVFTNFLSSAQLSFAANAIYPGTVVDVQVLANGNIDVKSRLSTDNPSATRFHQTYTPAQLTNPVIGGTTLTVRRIQWRCGADC